MEIGIKFFRVNNQEIFAADIYRDGIWIKEITGLFSIEDVLLSIAKNKDIIDQIKKYGITS